MIGNGPYCKQDLLNELATLRELELNFWLQIAPEQFARPIGQAWSPADTVRHLIKSTVPVTRALKLPRLVLRILFGQSNGTSMPCSNLIERYRVVLAGGGNAGRFSPSPLRVPTNIVGWQRDLMSECQSVVTALARALDTWTERDLDRYRLPHPLLGKLTVREMLFFTLYHYEHHKAIVAGRLGRLVATTSSSCRR